MGFLLDGVLHRTVFSIFSNVHWSFDLGFGIGGVWEMGSWAATSTLTSWGYSVWMAFFNTSYTYIFGGGEMLLLWAVGNPTMVYSSRDSF